MRRILDKETIQILIQQNHEFIQSEEQKLIAILSK